MQAEPTDEELMLAYGSGDVAAFQTLYSRHRGPLFRHLSRQLRDTALAEELFQDVWQRVITARERYRPDAKFGTWLYQIAHNRVTDHWRAKQHRPDAPGDADELAARVPDPETPDRQLSAFEERRRLQLALEELPDDQREVVLLRHFTELAYDEIAASIGVPVKTVKSRLYSARQRLAVLLAEKDLV